MFESLKKKLSSLAKKITKKLEKKPKEVIKKPIIKKEKPKEIIPEEKGEELKEQIVEVPEIKEAIIPKVKKVRKPVPEGKYLKEEIILEIPKAEEEIPKVKKLKTLEKIIKIFKKKEKPKKKEVKEEEPKKKEKPSLIKKLILKRISEKDIDDMLEDLEISLLENNVALEVIEQIKYNLKTDLTGKSIGRRKIKDFVIGSLKDSISDVLIEIDEKEIFKIIKENKKKNIPTVFMFLGVNGSGKTTSLGKLAKLFLNKGYSCVFSASDTFRAASIEQIQVHGDNLGIKVIKHKYGADSAAVAYDAIQYAKAHKINCVLIDTAGRSHTNINLMDELRKVARVTKPDFKVFVADSLVGNDAVEQSKAFNYAVGIDFSILAKADVDKKGGAILSVGFVTKKPIAFLGTGQKYKNLEVFKKNNIIKKMGL